MFEELLSRTIQDLHLAARPLAAGECRPGEGPTCPVCHAFPLEYPDEVRAKDAALSRFWREQNLPGALQPLVRSPRGRGYRTVSKRKVLMSGRSVQLALIASGNGRRGTPLEAVHCAIEPAEHAAIFQAARESLQRPYAQALAEELQYFIIKGDYSEFTVVLNVRTISAPVVRAANTLSKTLTWKVPSVAGFFLYEGDPGGEYYMGTRNPRHQPTVRRLFGRETIHQSVAGRHFLFSPLSFSQVNLSIVDLVVTAAGDMLEPEPGSTFLDLYCGYGLFAICLADRAGRVLGVELSPASVQAAVDNARRNRAGNTRFVRNDIDGTTIGRLLDQAGPGDVALLDPPRNGVAPGVIEAVAGRRLRRVVHLFCNIEIIGRELDRWHRSGYRTGRVLPFDMFPGTGAVELMVELTPEPVTGR